MIEQDLRQSIFYAPDHKWLSGVVTVDGEQKIRSPKVIIYAGGSEKRRDVMVHFFPQAQVFNYPGGDEEDSSDVLHTAYRKIQFVESNWTSLSVADFNINGPFGIIAADVRTLTQVINPDSSPRLLSRGKPKSREQVFARFGEMKEIVAHGHEPIYTVQAATVYKDKGLGAFLEGSDLVQVALDPSAVTHLATSTGFGMYLAEFDHFYRSPPYHNNGYRPLDVTDLSAGLSLPVLFRLGVVATIEGVSVDHPAFADTFRDAMYHVAVGISPRVLERVEPTAATNLKNWPWLNQVTQFCLEDNPYG